MLGIEHYLKDDFYFFHFMQFLQTYLNPLNKIRQNYSVKYNFFQF